MNAKELQNTLYYGDNLDIMKDELDDNIVDLIYLDPPFNSDQSYNVIFNERSGEKSRAQIKAFEDTWQWGRESEKEYKELVQEGPKQIADLMQAMRKFLGSNDMMSYLVMMTTRLIEMKRILKDTGSIYLHCDPTASHYLKLVMDAVFEFNFRNEIIWNYRKWPASKRQFQRNHDVILFYSKTGSENRTFNYMADPMPRAGSTKKRFGDSEIVSGYDENGNRKPSKTKDKKSKGVPRDDVWEISRVAPVKQLFPTQKPMKLLERIITYSSNPGDIVMDPFCGCGTTIAVAEKMDRTWIGIDITHLAVQLMKYRLEDTFEDKVDFQIKGVPITVKDAEQLAKQDRFQFESWAIGLIPRVKPVESQVGDRGIDGYKYFYDGPEGSEAKTMLVQVKSGKVGPSVVRDLKGTMEREQAEMGVLITLQDPTKEMEREAAEAGFYTSPVTNKDYPKIQNITIKELLEGKRVEMPRGGRDASLPEAEKHEEDKQQDLGLDN